MTSISANRWWRCCPRGSQSSPNSPLRKSSKSWRRWRSRQDLIAAANADLDVLNNQLVDTFQPPRQIIPMPPYGRPWVPDPDSIESGWPGRLNDDPRFRGIAGLGTWMGVEGQEALMDAAVQQAGALREAAQRVSYLALGLWAAGRLWDRRLPTTRTSSCASLALSWRAW